MKPEQGRYQAVTQVKGWSSENYLIREADTFHTSGRLNKTETVRGEVSTALAESKTTAWDQEDDLETWETQGVRPAVGTTEQQAMKSKELQKTRWESDQSIVPLKQGNACGGKGLTVVPESIGKHPPHAEADKRVKTKLGILTEKARANPKLRFTSLAHLLNEDFLKGCFEEIRRKKSSGGQSKAPGVDGLGVEEYGKNLEANLKGLVERMKAKAYRPQPVRRVYIPKPDGRQRPLGIPAVETESYSWE
jgi:hypothetical protein